MQYLIKKNTNSNLYDTTIAAQISSKELLEIAKTENVRVVDMSGNDITQRTLDKAKRKHNEHKNNDQATIN